MRIISTKLALLALIVPAFLLSAAAVDAKGLGSSNETDINLEIKDNKIVFSDRGKLLDYSQTISDNKGKTSDNEKVSRNANLPSGRFSINASAYTASADECGKNDGVTASGMPVKENETIACPRQFPFGTKLYIEGFGTYVCQDRGGAIKGNKVDIYMKTKAQAFAFGRRILSAQVIE